MNAVRVGWLWHVRCETTRHYQGKMYWRRAEWYTTRTVEHWVHEHWTHGWNTIRGDATEFTTRTDRDTTRGDTT